MNSNSLKHFTITSHNICGLNSPSCRTELAMFLAKTKPAVMVLQEPKMTQTTAAPPMKHYHGIHFAHPSKNTGIIMYIHHSVSYKILSHISHTSPYRPDETSTVVGFVWLSCPLLSYPIVVGGVYLSHAATESDITALTQCASLASAPLTTSPPDSPALPVFLVGDFNSRHPHWDADAPARPAPQALNKWVYQHLISSTSHNIKLTLINNMFTQSRKQYTHINTSHYMESVIDLAMTTDPSLVEGMCVSHELYTQSDHFPITITLRTATNRDQALKEPTTTRTRWRTDASEEKWTEFKQHMDNSLSEWIMTHRVFNTPTAQHMTQQQMDDCWQQLNSIITTAATETIGTKTIPANHKEWWDRDPALPQLHRDVCAARSRLNTLRKRHKRFPNSLSTAILLAHARTTLTTAKRNFRNLQRECRIQCLDELAGSLDDGRHKLLWSVWKRIAATPRIPLASFTKDDAPPLSPQQALNNLAQHLAKISSISPSSSLTSPECIMQEEHVQEYLSHVPPQSDVSLSPSFSLQDVVDLCSKSRLTTALGSDNISPHFLRRGGDTLHKALFLLFSICSRHGLIPSSFRHAHVVTLYKGDGDANDANNYRPIAITSVIARMYERLHMSELLRHMKSRGIPSTAQFGFTKQRSTHDAVYRLLSTIYDTINTGVGDFTPTVFIDISKAYDKVWIDGLLYKLHHDCQITGSLFYMLRALLVGRTMQVVHDNMISDVHTLTAGVPQGSVLAPLLFLIYIHSLTTSLSPSVCQSLFADDIALLPLTSGTAGLISLQTALNITTRYALRWKITFSSKKTQVLFFRLNSTRKQPTPIHHLTLTSFTLVTTRMYTYLGVLLDDRLTFIPHLTQLVHKTTATSLRITRMVRRDLLPSFPVIRRIVQSVLVPQMTYAFAFLFGMILNKRVTDTQTHDTEKVTHNIYSKLKNNILRPLRASLQLPFSVHHNSLFIEARLLNIDFLITLSSAQLVHRWLNMPSDANNAAAELFKQHISCITTLHQDHPCKRMCSAIGHDITPLLLFSPNDHSHLQSLSRSQIRTRIWQQQYETWLSTHATRPNSLPVYYPSLPEPIKPLPFYLTTEPPAAAARRARLRFRRTKFNFNLERIGYNIRSTCPHCHDKQEDNHHVLCECPQYSAARDACHDALSHLFPSSQPNPLLPLSVDRLISPETACANTPLVIPQALAITTAFFKQIAAIHVF